MKEIENLTPENSESLGFEWVQDVIYDESAPPEAMTEFIEFQTKGYALGQPASSSEVYVGLYRPLKSE